MELSIFSVFVQGIGIVGIIASILSFQCAGHKRLLLLRTVNELCFGIQYGLLGAFTGIAMNLIGCIRNLVFTGLVEKKKSTLSMQIVFSAVFLVLIFATWSGYKSLLSGVAKVLSTIAYGNSNTGFVRAIILITSTSWLIYNYMVKSYAGCVCELLTLSSIRVGMIRVDLPGLRKRRSRNTVSTR